MGCGSSGGVPRIGGNWGVCDPANPKNRRGRCSLLIEGRDGDAEPTRIVIDTGCDLREQLLDANVDRVDAVLYTHEHADHTHGIDDLRVLALNNRKRVDVYFSHEAATADRAELRLLLHGAAGQRLSADPQPEPDRRRAAADRRRAGRRHQLCCRSNRTMATSSRSASGSATSPIPAT